MAVVLQKVFVSLQSLMPTIIAHLEMAYPTLFDDATYSLHEQGKGLIGLNLHSDKYPSTLFWIDERLDVRPAYRSRYTEEQRQLDSKLKTNISELLKRAIV